MRISITSFSVIAGAMLLLFSCKKENIPAKTAELSLSPEPTDLVFHAQPQSTYTFTVTTNQNEWDLDVTPKEAEAWCKIIDLTAEGFTVAAEVNDSAEPRLQATITVTAGKAEPVAFKVDQRGSETARFLAWATDYANGWGHSSNQNFTLLEDIDLSSVANFTPIGTYEAPYSGVFDGGGHTIRNLTIDNGSEWYVGLFGYVTLSGSIVNLNLDNVNVTGRTSARYVGALAACCRGPIYNCTSSGTVKATGELSWSIGLGGLVGTVSGERSMAMCSSECNVTVEVTFSGESSSIYAGGLAGEIENGYTVAGCYATGDVSIKANNGPVTWAGGFAGRVASNVWYCYATGEASNENSGVAYNEAKGFAGDVGSSKAKIYNSYTTSDTFIADRYLHSETVIANSWKSGGEAEKMVINTGTPGDLVRTSATSDLVKVWIDGTLADRKFESSGIWSSGDYPTINGDYTGIPAN